MGISIFIYTHEDGLENFVLSPRIDRDSLIDSGEPLEIPSPRMNKKTQLVTHTQSSLE